MQDYSSFLLIAAAGVAFYFLLIRPNQQRQKRQRAMMASLAPGTTVMTSSGIFGTVTASSAEEVSVEVSPGVVLRFLPAAISQVVSTPGLPEDPVD